MGWVMNFQHVSSSRVAGAVSVSLTLEIPVSKGEESAVHVMRGLQGGSHVASHAEVVGTLDLT